MHTNAAWISLSDELAGMLKKDRLEEALLGLAHALKHIVPISVMCDPSDISVVPQMKATHNDQPTVFLYDKYPGGVGLAGKYLKQWKSCSVKRMP